MCIRDRWYTRDAQQGGRWSQHALGQYYELGCGVKKDLRLAMHWYEKAAQQKDIPSMFRLALLHYETDSPAEAVLYWLQKAADNYYAPAEFRLGMMYDSGIIFDEDKIEAEKWYSRARQNVETEGLDITDGSIPGMKACP